MAVPCCFAEANTPKPKGWEPIACLEIASRFHRQSIDQNRLYRLLNSLKSVCSIRENMSVLCKHSSAMQSISRLSALPQVKLACDKKDQVNAISRKYFCHVIHDIEVRSLERFNSIHPNGPGRVRPSFASSAALIMVSLRGKECFNEA